MNQQHQHQPWLDELARYLESHIPGRASTNPGTESPPAELVEGLFARQLALNQPASTVLERRGRPVSSQPVRSLAEIPAIPVAAFKALELTTVPAAQRVAVFHSSGTTGHEPSRHFHSRETIGIYRLALEAWFKRRMLGDFSWAWQPDAPHPSDRPQLIGLTPDPEAAPNSSLAFMAGTLMNRFGDATSSFYGRVDSTGWELDLSALLMTLRQAADRCRPVIIVGTAFNFVHLLDELERIGSAVALPPGSRVMETGGYKGCSRIVSKSDLRELISARLGVPPRFIAAEYGMSELSSQAYDADFSLDRPGGHGLPAPRSEPASSGLTGRRLQFPPWCHVAVVSPETGQELPPGTPGLLRIADLANVASVLAIQTEDLAVRHADGLELLGRATQAEPRGCSLL